MTADFNFDDDLPDGYTSSTTLAFNDNFTSTVEGEIGKQSALFDDGQTMLKLVLTPEQIKHAYSLFSLLYIDNVEAGAIEAYPDLPVKTR